MGLAHLQLSPSWQPSSSHERLRTLKGSIFLTGKKEFGACFGSSQVPEPSDSDSPATSCFQEFNVAREHKMCSPLVSRKGNQEHVPVGVRFVLLDQRSRPDWYGGNNHRTSLPRRSLVGSNMESRSSSKRVFPLRRNPRRRNSSTRKMWISRFKIFSRADGSGNCGDTSRKGVRLFASTMSYKA